MNNKLQNNSAKKELLYNIQSAQPLGVYDFTFMTLDTQVVS